MIVSFSPAAVCKDWSVVGPVFEDFVDPAFLDQSKSSVLSKENPHRSVSKVHD